MPTPQTLPYSQNFSSFSAGTETTYPAGWQGWQVGSAAPSSGGRTNAPTADLTIIATGTAASTGSGIYNFKDKIGILSISNKDYALALSINTTGATKVGISFDAMTIRNIYDGTTNNYIHGLVLQYRVGVTDVFTALPYSMTEYQNNATAQTTGTTGQNIKVSLNATLPSGCDNQSVVQIRWIYRTVSGSAGSRCSMAIDNVFVGVSASSITPLTYSPGDAVSVPFTANGTYTGGFKAQLSDSTGSFATPTDIGTTTSNVSGTISATIPSGAVSGSTYRIRTVSITPSIHGSDNGANITVAPLLNYYYKGSGSLSDITNWGTNTNGTGSTPPDFISAGQLFNIRNTTAVATTAAWTVAGTGSKIIVGDASVAPVALTIASGYPITTTSPAVLDISAASSSGSNILVLQDINFPTFGNLDATTEIRCSGITANFGSAANLFTKTIKTLLIQNNSTITLFGLSNNIATVNSNLTVDQGSTLVTGGVSSSYIIIGIGGSAIINGTVKTIKTTGFVSSGTPSSSGGSIQFAGSESLTLGSNSTIEFNRFSSGTAQTIDARPDYKNLIISGLDNNKTFATGTLSISGALTFGMTGTSSLTQPSLTTINYTGSTAQTLPSAITTYSNLGFSESSTKTINSNTTVTGVLTVGTGATLATGGFLTLKSNADGTATVAPVLGTITGNVTVERYIPAKRAWRALTAPLKGTDTSIFSQWQNNGNSSDTTIGVELWGPGGTGSSGNGLAVGPNNSILQYAAGNWSAVSNTTSTNLFTTSGNNAFMIFPTGGYGSGLIDSNTTPVATTLKATGQLITGDVTYSGLSDTSHTLIGNPYASPIDLNSILDNSTTLQKYFWVWDPNAANQGAYNLFDAAANTYSVTNLSYTNSTVIQSGQAFFVKAATGQTGSFTISESNKSTATASTVFRTAAPELLRVGLYKQENNEWSGRDGAMTVILSDAAANQSPNKMANSTENIAFTKYGANFASNHHLPLVASDVLNVKVWNTTAGANYKLKINTEEFTATNLEATLEDLFTNSRTPLTLDGSAVEYPFTVTTEALSTGDRFRIVFQTSALGMNNPKANGFSIVPNPVTGDSFQVNLGSLATGIYSYTICNAIGQEVEKGSIQNATQNTNYEVKMSNAATGVYIMKIKGSDNSVFTAKIIKK